MAQIYLYTKATIATVYGTIGNENQVKVNFQRFRLSRILQTALVRFRSGHLRGMIFVQGLKSFFTYRCSLCASPDFLDCWGISEGQLFGDQDQACDILRRNGQMDLV
ncbi:hypothetical protein TNCV_4384771 [Trichonephila clavipes]|nr:hypothetical protein TNCV_4384771 [Trichonephila clavipes]